MIEFYSPKKSYGCFSNFSPDEVIFVGLRFPTSEAAFQASKFWPHDIQKMIKIYTAGTPLIAAKLGRELGGLRPDWELSPNPLLIEQLMGLPWNPTQPDDLIVRPEAPEPILTRTKDLFMYAICRLKFQKPGLKSILLSTKREPLAEASPRDDYWGLGENRIGQNKLGRILMAVRDELRR